MLFALAWYYRATKDASAIQLADATWASMQTRLADAVHGGFFEEALDRGEQLGDVGSVVHASPRRKQSSSSSASTVRRPSERNATPP